MNTCQGLFGRLFGHHFVGMHDNEPTIKNLKEQAGEIDQEWMEEVINASRKYTYRGAVCERCGAVVLADREQR